MNMSKTLCFKEFTVCGRRSSSPLMGGGGTCGYRILEASHGAEAIQTCEQSQDPIHLLVTDVVMPGIGGRQLAEILRSKHPDLKVLYLSGYTDDAVVRHGVLEAGTNFLQKPFTPSSLAQKVREVLDKEKQ